MTQYSILERHPCVAVRKATQKITKRISDLDIIVTGSIHHKRRIFGGKDYLLKTGYDRSQAMERNQVVHETLHLNDTTSTSVEIDQCVSDLLEQTIASKKTTIVASEILKEENINDRSHKHSFITSLKRKVSKDAKSYETDFRLLQAAIKIPGHFSPLHDEFNKISQFPASETRLKTETIRPLWSGKSCSLTSLASILIRHFSLPSTVSKGKFTNRKEQNFFQTSLTLSYDVEDVLQISCESAQICATNHKNISNLVQALNSKAISSASHGNYGESLDLFQALLKVHLATKGRVHAVVASAHHNIGVLQIKLSHTMTTRKDVDKCKLNAFESFQKAACVAHWALGQNHPNVAHYLVRIGFLLLERKQFQNALTTFKEALRIRDYYFGRQHPLVAKIHNNLGISFLHLGNYTEGLNSFENALEIQQNIYGKWLLNDTEGVVVNRHDESRAQLLLEMADTLCNISLTCLNGAHVNHSFDSLNNQKKSIQKAVVSITEALSIRSSYLKPGSPKIEDTKDFYNQVKRLHQIIGASEEKTITNYNYVKRNGNRLGVSKSHEDSISYQFCDSAQRVGCSHQSALKEDDIESIQYESKEEKENQDIKSQLNLNFLTSPYVMPISSRPLLQDISNTLTRELPCSGFLNESLKRKKKFDCLALKEEGNRVYSVEFGDSKKGPLLSPNKLDESDISSSGKLTQFPSDECSFISHPYPLSSSLQIIPSHARDKNKFTPSILQSSFLSLRALHLNNGRQFSKEPEKKESKLPQIASVLSNQASCLSENSMRRKINSSLRIWDSKLTEKNSSTPNVNSIYSVTLKGNQGWRKSKSNASFNKNQQCENKEARRVLTSPHVSRESRINLDSSIETSKEQNASDSLKNDDRTIARCIGKGCSTEDDYSFNPHFATQSGSGSTITKQYQKFPPVVCSSHLAENGLASPEIKGDACHSDFRENRVLSAPAKRTHKLHALAARYLEVVLKMLYLSFNAS